MGSASVTVEGEELLLLPERAVLWSKKKTLLLSDLHLGKAGHFRKHGIPVSRRVHLDDINNLHGLIEKYRPERVLLLGDLFHSYENCEWEDFTSFLAVHERLRFILVQGNHDIFPEYPSEFEVVTQLNDPPFSFTHIKQKDQYYNISGHIHPGITIRGKARQGITMPCFLFSNGYALLPAYGGFTGIKKIRPLRNDRVFAIADRQVVELS